MRPELTLLWLAPCVALTAEDPKPVAEATLQFISLAGDREDLALWDGSKATPLRLSADFFGPSIRYAGEPRLRLIKPEPGAPAAANVAVKPPVETTAPSPATAPGPTVAWLDLPPSNGPRKLILLVQPEPGQNGILAMKDTPGDFPAGSIRLLNLCDFAVTLEDGRRVTAVAAKDTAVIRPPTAAGSYYDAAVYSEEDKVRRLAYHLHFFCTRERRTLLFILPVEKGTGLVRLQPVEDPPTVEPVDSPQEPKVRSPQVAK
jgi:hypothetical protein